MIVYFAADSYGLIQARNCFFCRMKDKRIKMENRQRIDILAEEHRLPYEEWEKLFCSRNTEDRLYAAQRARKVSQKIFSNKVYVRAIVEFSNICANDCLYCGIRSSNKKALRYRLSFEEIMQCCAKAYEEGFRTFVLQSGEDAFYWKDGLLVRIVEALHKRYPDCAITLSVGELTRQQYQTLFDAGADRYLLRHESANPKHYDLLHNNKLSWENRMRCLRDLAEIGYQVGCGFMVQSPFQTPQILAEEMVFMQDFDMAMIGIGPFIPHCDTPFAQEKAGTLELTLFLMSLCRLMKPSVLLPATTALGTIHPQGREQGILAGGNVIMPCMTPEQVRNKYVLYNEKNSLPAAENILYSDLQSRMEKIGYTLVVDRGDHQKGAVLA